MKTKQILFYGVLAACAFPQLASATNGMNMEGYGAIALGMGGASMAYDNGTAAMMNNPATLAMMDEGVNLDLALGFLAPQVKSSVDGTTSRSSADMFGGPAFGLVRKHNGLVYGVGVYGQGGMGTEYGNDSILSNPNVDPLRQSPNLVNRSEVSVGRVIFPLAYDVNPNLKIGGSVDYVWAGMDLKMAVNGLDFLKMAGGVSPMARAFGPMVDSFKGMMISGKISAVNWGYFDFSNQNDFTGQAVGTGYAGKIGFTYKLDSKTTLGATYHSKTRLGDLEAQDATVLFNVDYAGVGGLTNQRIPVTGKMTVKDFQWPETYGIGIAYEASEKWKLAADYKRINWADAMKNFTMEFTPTGNAFNGLPMDVVFYQDWKDQHVLILGAAYRMTDALTLRAGLNMANNPVPDTYLNALFPATIKNHITAGSGYAIGKNSNLDLAFSYAAKETATSGVTGITTSHEQYNGQLVYSIHY